MNASYRDIGGNQIPEDNQFCGKCGTNVVQA